MRGFRDRDDAQTVLQLLRARIQPLAAETIVPWSAAGRVLASAIHADIDVPPFTRAAMDGYALRGRETFGAGPFNPLELAVVGAALPGKPYAGVVAEGQAVRIMTGAPVPEGADAVLPAEAAEEVADRLRVVDAVPPGRHIGRRGEDIPRGAVVLSAGRVLRPQDLGVLASLGVERIAVIRQPVVAVLITGDELLPRGAKPEGFRIVDSNSVMLEALIRRDGGIPNLAPILPDQYDVIRSAVVATSADMVLISGGSSVGQEDHAPRVLHEVGELCVHGVAMRPASPTGLGFHAGRPVFLLPGNPVSCLSAYDLFAGPALRCLGGRSVSFAAPGADLPYRRRLLPLSKKIASAVGRLDYVRVRVVDDQVEPLAISGASQLSSTTRADGFVLVPPDSEGQPAGDMVEVHLYDA